MSPLKASLVFIILILALVIEKTHSLCCGCETVRNGMGCPADAACQQTVCWDGYTKIDLKADHYCCDSQWDGNCVNEAYQVCNAQRRRLKERLNNMQ